MHAQHQLEAVKNKNTNPLHHHPPPPPQHTECEFNTVKNP